MTLNILGTEYNVAKVVERKPTVCQDLIKFLFPSCSEEQEKRFIFWFDTKRKFSDNIICVHESQPFRHICESSGLDSENRKVVVTKKKVYVLQ